MDLTWGASRMTCLATAFQVLVAVTAHASAISFTGVVTPIAAPADARLNQLESDTLAHFFTEVVDHTLLAPLTADTDTPGTYPPTLLVPVVIPAGTRVDSYYLITDPVGTPNASREFIGSITFDTDILGLIVNDPTFAASNAAVGHPGTLYSNAGIGVEIGSPDTFTLSANRRTLSFDMVSGPAADDIRIITAQSVPEPATGVLVVTGLAALLRRRRRTAV
jgi:PEP-CTERM motif-containing protein